MTELTDRQCALMILASLEERGSRRAYGKVTFGPALLS